MRILWISTLSTGSGHIMLAGTLQSALRRAGESHHLKVLHGTQFQHLGTLLDLHIEELAPEAEDVLLGRGRRESHLYREIDDFAPEVLIIEGAWFAVHDLIHDFDMPKIGLFLGMLPQFFSMELPDRVIHLDSAAYDRVFAIEPFDAPFPAERLDPMLLRNPDEILARDEAAARLDIEPDRPTAYIALNGRPGEFDMLRKTYSYLEDQYQVVYSSNYEGGIFPALDYYNAFDLIVCGAGYSQFWEAMRFEKEAVFVPQLRRFESQAWRVEHCQDYPVWGNGAEQLAGVISELGKGV